MSDPKPKANPERKKILTEEEFFKSFYDDERKVPEYESEPSPHGTIKLGPGESLAKVRLSEGERIDWNKIKMIVEEEGYTTKDSGEREQYQSGMVRDTNKDKTRYDLLIPEDFKSSSMLVRWAELLTRGAEKYDARNWEKASTTEEYYRFKESAFRHFMQWYMGETDEDHAAAVYFNIQGAEYTAVKVLDETLGD